MRSTDFNADIYLPDIANMVDISAIESIVSCKGFFKSNGTISQLEAAFVFLLCVGFLKEAWTPRKKSLQSEL